MAKLKAQQQQNSQSSKKLVEKPVEVKKEIAEETLNSTEENDDMVELDDEMPEKTEKASVSEQKQVSDEERKAEILAVQETEILQNNGIFRREILAQMQELNKALVAIASILVEHGKK